MLLSIIVPAYNIEDHLQRCLRSLLDQDFDPSDYEIVVIDDGSEDNSAAIAEALALTNPNVVVHSQENQGLSAARNAGIRLARGKYIYFVDGDDYIASQVLAGLVKLMDEEGLQVLGFDHAIVGPDDYLPHSRTPYDLSQGVAVSSGAQHLATHHYLNAVWWYIVDRAFLAELGVLFEVGRLVEDGLFTANVMCAASRFAFVPIDVYRYVRRPGSIMQTSTAAHTRKLIADYERVVFGLEELRQRLLKSDTASEALLDRLEYRQRAYVFFLIGRLIRSDLPPKPILPDALARFRVIDIYPLKRFPGRDYRGVRYALLTFVFNREYLLYPFIHIYRSLRGSGPFEFRQE
jgi:glycosyltransferase involved in cell wall biosynthesis